MPALNDLSAEVVRLARTDRTLPAPATPQMERNIEEWFTYLVEDHPWLNREEHLRNQAAYFGLARLMTNVLSKAQAEVLQESCPLWLQHLIRKWHLDTSWVLTLNYDSLVEKAAADAGRDPDRTRVSSSQLYPVPITPIALRSAGTWGTEKVSTLKLLKLHGSISWCYSGAPSFFGESIYDVGETLGWAPDDFDSIYSLSAIDKVPLVVPPTFQKTAFFTNETIRSQWRLARSALEQCGRVFCLGYSLPSSDIMMRFLLGICLKDKPLFVVDTSDGTLERYRQLLAGVDVQGDYVTPESAIEAFCDTYAEAVDLPYPVHPISET